MGAYRSSKITQGKRAAGAREQRRAAMKAKGRNAWKPDRDRKLSAALRAYAALATSASTGAVRNVDQVGG